MKKKVMITTVAIVAVIGLLWLGLVLEQSAKERWPGEVREFCIENREMLNEFAELCLEKIERIIKCTPYKNGSYIKIRSFDVYFHEELNEQEISFLDAALARLEKYRTDAVGISRYYDYVSIRMGSYGFEIELVCLNDPKLLDEYVERKYIRKATPAADNWYVMK